MFTCMSVHHVRVWCQGEVGQKMTSDLLELDLGRIEPGSFSKTNAQCICFCESSEPSLQPLKLFQESHFRTNVMVRSESICHNSC